MDTSSPDRLAAHLMAFVSSSRVIRRRISRGGSVFRQGDTGTAIFIVETGRVRLVRTLSDGTTLTLYVAEAGESFAEAVLSAASYHCDAVADIDSVVISLPKSDLLSALSSDPAKCLELAMALAGQVRDLRARLELRNIRSATERLLTWLHLHASGDPSSVPMHRSWTSIDRKSTV